jgi:molybdenum cofactor cytidylyltransferase
MAEIDCLVLAAGKSSRMEDWKMTLPWNCGTVIEQSVRTALEVCSRVVLVAGFRAEELFELFRDQPRVEVVRNEKFTEGMFSSIQKAVRSAREGAFFIALGDMPEISVEVFRELAEWERRLRPVFAASGLPYGVIPKYGGKKGHPVLLSSGMRSRILETDVSKTLRDVLALVPTVIVPVEEGGVLQDIDTPEDYRSRRGPA